VSGTLYAEKIGDAIELNAGHTDKELVRAIPGSRFHSPPPVWTVPLSWAVCRQLRGTFGARLSIGPDLRRWAEDELESRVNKALVLREEALGGSIPIKPPAGNKLRPFQESDVRWMLAAQSGLLMNPVGAGKTPSTLTWMRNNALEMVLVICPAQMRLVWAAEAATWYPELEPIPIIGTAAERRRLIDEVAGYGGLGIIGLEATRLHSRLAPYGPVRLSEAEKQVKELNLIKWDAVVVDEAHRLKDPKSKMTRAAWAVGQNAQHRWGLTATPQTKGLDTLWSPLHFVDPVEWPSRVKFVDRYCMVATNFWGGITVGALRPEMEAEFQSIFDPRSRRLPKPVVLPQLPDVVRVVRELDMTKEQDEAYRQMAELSLATVDAQDVVVATSTAAQYTRMGQFASSFAHVEVRMVKNRETGEEEPKEFVELNTPSNKIDAFLSDLEDWQAQEECVAAFASSRRLIMLLSEVLDKRKIGHSLVVGGQKDIERYEQIQRFQEGEVDVILVVIAAGGSGITLTRARIGAVLQRSWSNVDDQQMEGRWNRIGSEVHDSTLRVDYISKGTVDVGQYYDVLPGKEEMAQKVLRDKETIRRMLKGQRP
jgi:chromodomain helicase DNA binding protein 8